MCVLLRFSILSLVFFVLILLGSCHKKKTTEAIISNQTDYDFTISFRKGGSGYLVNSKSEKTVHVGGEEYPQLTFPFVSDTVIVMLNKQKQYFFAESKMHEENNIFNIENWTYTTYTNYYTKATYTFTNKILTNMEEKQ